MAHTKSAEKRIRQTEKRRLANKSNKSAMKTSIKKFLAAVGEGDKNKAETLLKKSVSVIYRTASKNVIHKRQAGRKVSRLVKKLDAISGK